MATAGSLPPVEGALEIENLHRGDIPLDRLIGIVLACLLPLVVVVELK
tara:strand:+ start:2413 stop:2556 length:144 start_codon:yes stop_codon:yes gene_type:complete